MKIRIIKMMFAASQTPNDDETVKKRHAQAISVKKKLPNLMSSNLCSLSQSNISGIFGNYFSFYIAIGSSGLTGEKILEELVNYVNLIG